MKLAKGDREQMVKAFSPTADNSPRYPYGLRLDLSSESLEKLGMKAMPKVGAKLMLEAEVEVQSVSIGDSVDGGKNRSLSIQVTEMALGTGKEESDEEKFYGEA